MEEVENIRIPPIKFPPIKFPTIKLPHIRIPERVKAAIIAALKTGTKWAATQACRKLIFDSILCDAAVEAIAAALGK